MDVIDTLQVLVFLTVGLSPFLIAFAQIKLSDKDEGVSPDLLEEGDRHVFEDLRHRIEKVCVITYVDEPLRYGRFQQRLKSPAARLLRGPFRKAEQVVYEAFLVTKDGETLDWKRGDASVEMDAIELAKRLGVPLEHERSNVPNEVSLLLIDVGFSRQ